VIPLIYTQNKKKIWGADVDEFKPERFSAENMKNIHPFAYLPFARGPRACMGISYSMKSMKVVLSYLLRNYKISTAIKMENVKFEFVTVTKVVQGCMVTLDKRQFLNK
jgi:cytochrome P450